MNDLIWGNYHLKLSQRTHIMGIINITPDSFSKDGLVNFKIDKIINIAKKMVSNGADIIDIGGESTRPGARYISAKEEIKRVIPVINKITKCIKIPISIDTYKTEVARAALEAGASIVNTIKGLRNNLKLTKLVRRFRVPVIVMHIKGTPRRMQKNPRYKSVIAEIIKDLKEQISFAQRLGVESNKIIIDPGIGFGKTTSHNLEIIKNLARFRNLNKPIAIGTSRKSLIGEILSLPVGRRLMGTAATVSLAIANGANIIRVHDVNEMAQVSRMTDAIVRSSNK